MQRMRIRATNVETPNHSPTHTNTIHNYIYTPSTPLRPLTVARGLVPFKLREVVFQFEFAFIYLVLQDVLLVQEEDNRHLL